MVTYKRYKRKRYNLFRAIKELKECTMKIK